MIKNNSQMKKKNNRVFSSITCKEENGPEPDTLLVYLQ